MMRGVEHQEVFMLRNFLIAAALTASIAAPAKATTVGIEALATYVSTNGTSLPATTVASGVTASDVQRGPGLLENFGSTFNSRNWTLGGNADVGNANGDVLTFGFVFTENFSLTSLDLGYDRSPFGPMGVTIDISYVDEFGFTTTIDDYFTDTDVDVNGETNVIDLTGFNNLQSLDFLLIGYNATGLAGTFDLENRIGNSAIVLNGSPAVAPVPLPAGLPLLVGALGLLGWTRRRS